MLTAPRLTGALRAFGSVCAGHDASGEAGHGKDVAERKALALQEQTKSCVSWQRICDTVQCTGDKTKRRQEVDTCLKELTAAAKAIVGTESSVETVLSAAAYLFDLFKSAQSVGQAEAHSLQNTFGPYPASQARKACVTVNEIVSHLSEETVQELSALSNQREDGDGAEMQEEFGAQIKFSMDMWPQEDLSSSDSEDEVVAIREMDLRYTGEAVSEPQSGRDQNMANGHNSIDSLWFHKQMAACFASQDTGLGLSLEELSTHVIDLLTSPQSDDALQNALFELLGFDQFQLIQVLLENRKMFVNNISMEATREAILQAQKLERGEQRPTYGCQVTVQSAEERELQKLIRREEKRLNKKEKKADPADLNAMAFDVEEMRMARETALRNAKIKPILSGSTYQPQMRETYPFVFDRFEEVRHTSAYISGSKLVLPDGFQREDDEIYEEINIPPSEPAPTNIGKDRVAIESLDEIARLAFKGTKALNRIQSVVFNTAYHSNQNMLICAPTGAGKTNIAMLSILHEVRQHLVQGVIKKDEFKIVYVAPMKALAAEMVRNFGGRLEALGISVRELTGDMSLTKQEILKTQMLVTTPEKWDVVTRKSTGDVGLAQLVRLLIIDEVHLLHDDRGAVIESLVARTLRQVESSQSMIRIVGLSATLPNYIDVARFLHVNPYEGLFFFDGRFRPVPLGQTFIGIKASNKLNQLRDMNQVCYEKVLKQVKAGYQVMVFVHARNETVRTAMHFRDLARNNGQVSFFLPEEGPKYGEAQKNVMRSRNKQLKELFSEGFAMHHAGMLRQDRNLVERYFAEGHIKVLCCTATLAWGVNLPAHAVIIKGTQIYDAKRGAFVDLSILDVMQIFGRAGRPQFDTFGHGTIITTHDKLSHYLLLMTRQNPIESQFVNSLTDNLNAEVALGTVTTLDEAVRWLSYTYLFVRMRLNPLVYGIPHDAEERDPLLKQHRYELLVDAARRLDKARMIRFDEGTGFLFSTDLGRIASHFYIKYATVEVINERFNAVMTEADIYSLVSNAQEFDQIKVREDEMEELDQMVYNGCEMTVAGGKENTQGKVNILLQSYVSRIPVDSFSLVSDMAYVAQNAGRIMRALFEVALRSSWPMMAGRLLEQCKTVDKRLWGFEHPLRQFPVLTPEILSKLEQRRLSVDKLRDMDSKEIGHMVHHVRMGPVIKRCVLQLPCLELEATIQPITRTVLRVRLDIVADFKWDDKVHGASEPFWIWVEDPENNHIYHTEYLLLHKKQAVSDEPHMVVFTIPIFEPLPSQYYVRAVSDRWIGSSSVCAISFQHLILPEKHPPHTTLLNLQPLPLTALNDVRLEALYNFTHFNPVQTQIFHTLYHSDCNVLLGAPTGSGKTVAAELAIFRVFREYPKAKAVYIAPLKALVRERMDDWKVRFEQKLGKKVVEMTGDVTPDMRAVAKADLIVTTPEKWDGVSRSWQTRSYVQAVAVLVIDEIHLLGDERGPVLEVIVSRTNFISSHTSKKVRVVGLSTALANARDLADWLGIKEMGLFNFRPSVRPVPLAVHIKGFPGQHYCPRMATMNKPTFQDIKTHSPTKPVLIFVSSRRQTRLTALDLIAFLAVEENPKQWLHMPEAEIDNIISGIGDNNLKLMLAFGIGIHHAGLMERDRKVVEELFVNQRIQVLIATSTLAWGVNFPAHLVVIKGTEYFDGKTRRYVDFPITDVLQMMGRAGRPQFDDEGVACIMVHDIKKHFYKKFLYEPFPVESNLLDVLPDHINAEIVAGTISSKQDAMDYITWTYFFRRLVMNPSFYNLNDTDFDQVNQYLSSLVDKALMQLECSSCLEIAEDDSSIRPLTLGHISSYYYLNHNTVRMFSDRLKADVSIPDIIDILSSAHEFSQLPVRHNEDQLNRELAGKVVLEVSPHTLDSPHTKTNLLLQAHFSQLPLPSTDYNTDTKSVLDQTIRVLQAMLDVCADRGWLTASLQVITLLQMVLQGRWWNDSSLLTLPHLELYHLPCFRTARSEARGKKKQADGTCSIDCLPQLMAACDSNKQFLYSALADELPHNHIQQISNIVEHLPQMDVHMAVKGRWPGECEETTKPISIPRHGGPATDTEWLQVHADQEYVLHVSLHRLNRSNKKTGSKAHSPRFPKPKDEGWFLLVGDVEAQELVALKRVGYVRGGTTAQLTFFTPQTMGRVILTLYFMSDSYLGLDQQYDLCLHTVAQSTEDNHHTTPDPDLYQEHEVKFTSLE